MHLDKVPLIRRVTGGGACYVDKGNRLFSFIQPFIPNQGFKDNYPILTRALTSLGFNVTISGRNDLIIGDKKISGSAFTVTGNVLKHHGTLLINVDKHLLTKYLTPTKLKLKSKGINSVESRIVNLTDINPSISINDIDNALVNSFKEYLSSAIDKIIVDPHDITSPSFSKLYNKFISHDYIYNHNPEFTHKLEHKFSFGLVELFLFCNKNKIIDYQIYSDSLDLDFITHLKYCFSKLIGLEYNLNLPLELQKSSLDQYHHQMNEFCEWLAINL